MILEKDEIIIRKMTMHVLDTTSGKFVPGKHLIRLTEGVTDYIRDHIYKLLASDEMKPGSFGESVSIYPILSKLDEKDEEAFASAMEEIAKKMYDVMQDEPAIPAGDLICVSYQTEGKTSYAFLKMNYTNHYAHKIKDEETNISVERSIQTSSRLKEAIIVEPHKKQILIAEPFYKNEGGDRFLWISEKFLKTIPELSPKSKFDLLNKTIKNVCKKTKMSVKDMCKVRMDLREETRDTGIFDVESVGDLLFGNDPERKEMFDEEMEKAGIAYDTFTVTKESLLKKLDQITLTDINGIKLTLNVDELYSDLHFKIKENKDDTITLILSDMESVAVR